MIEGVFLKKAMNGHALLSITMDITVYDRHNARLVVVFSTSFECTYVYNVYKITYSKNMNNPNNR